MKKFTDFKLPKSKIMESFHMPDGTPIGVDKYHRPIMEQEVSEKSPEAKFFSKLFETREMAHVYHLQVRGDEGSHAAHKALGDYYEEVLELIDDTIEVYQGQYDIIEGYDIIDTDMTKEMDRLEYFQQTVEIIKKDRYTALKEEDAHLQAIIDEIVNLMYKLIYKLRFNK